MPRKWIQRNNITILLFKYAYSIAKISSDLKQSLKDFNRCFALKVLNISRNASGI